VNEYPDTVPASVIAEFLRSLGIDPFRVIEVHIGQLVLTVSQERTDADGHVIAGEDGPLIETVQIRVIGTHAFRAGEGFRADRCVSASESVDNSVCWLPPDHPVHARDEEEVSDGAA